MKADAILLCCLKKGCPRQKRIPRGDFPKDVVRGESYCPWHEPQGAKAYPEYWYDANGKDISEKVNHPKTTAAPDLRA